MQKYFYILAFYRFCDKLLYTVVFWDLTGQTKTRKRKKNLNFQFLLNKNQRNYLAIEPTQNRNKLTLFTNILGNYKSYSHHILIVFLNFPTVRQ